MTDDKAAIEQRVMDKIHSQELALVEDAAVKQAKYIDAIRNSTLARWCLAQGVAIPILGSALRKNVSWYIWWTKCWRLNRERIPAISKRT